MLKTECFYQLEYPSTQVGGINKIYLMVGTLCGLNIPIIRVSLIEVQLDALSSDMQCFQPKINTYWNRQEVNYILT